MRNYRYIPKGPLRTALATEEILSEARTLANSITANREKLREAKAEDQSWSAVEELQVCLRRLEYDWKELEHDLERVAEYNEG